MPAVTGQQVANALGQGTDTAVVALADELAPIVTTLAKSYTRDRGFTLGVPNAEIAAVILLATGRLVSNPEQIPSDVGSISVRGGFNGWSLAERTVLNRYRVTAQ